MTARLAIAGALSLAVLVASAPVLAEETPADSAAVTVEKVEKVEEVEKAENKAAVKTEKAAKVKKSKKSDAKLKGASVTEKAMAVSTMPVKPQVEPQHVQVQHILIAFAGSGTRASRPMEDAKKLAYEILARARKGEDYDALVKQYTDDSPPGIYGMSGLGVAKGAGEHARDTMVPAFGNVGFAISPGNIGIADYDPQTSPFGWHIIKRLK